MGKHFAQDSHEPNHVFKQRCPSWIKHIFAALHGKSMQQFQGKELGSNNFKDTPGPKEVRRQIGSRDNGLSGFQSPDDLQQLLPLAIPKWFWISVQHWKGCTVHKTLRGINLPVRKTGDDKKEQFSQHKCHPGFCNEFSPCLFVKGDFVLRHMKFRPRVQPRQRSNEDNNSNM